MEHENFITDFCNTIDQCHGVRPDKLWFSTWMSSKSPYFSYPQNFEKFWTSGQLPPTMTFPKKLALTFRLSLTMLSILAKSTYLKWQLRNELAEINQSSGKEFNLVRTFAYSDNPQVSDPFWGEFIEKLTQSSVNLLTIYDPSFSITKCKRAYNSKKRNFPYLVFVSPRKVLNNFSLILVEVFKAQSFPSQKVRGIELKYFITDSYKTELLAPSSLVNLVCFDCYQNILQKFSIKKAYLTFENNPWEKMFYLARSASKKQFKILGFQHASIQRDATNYFLSSYENLHNLHPDKILSVGQITYEYMKNLPHYKNINIGVGCALRYSYLENIELINSPTENKNLNLLVMLDGTQDTVNLIKLVLEFVKINKLDKLSIKIKEHPSLLIRNFYPEFLTNKAVLSKKIIIASGGLQENLNQSDIILYTGTTSSIEALRLGKAVINYNFALFNYDPLFQFKDFKWTITKPNELIDIFKEYLKLTPQEIIQRKLSAKNFVNNYFSPCTKENIERFL